jgi:hypothetical protein
LKNAVVTQDLRSTLAAQGVENNRGSLEAQADSLVAEYLRQVDFETLADAERMSEFYKLFYALENDMRDLIESTLADSKGGNWWADAVPQAVRDNAQRNYDGKRRRACRPAQTD